MEWVNKWSSVQHANKAISSQPRSEIPKEFRYITLSQSLSVLFGFSQSITQKEMQKHCEVERLPNQEPDQGVAFHSCLRSGFITPGVSDTIIQVIKADSLIINRFLLTLNQFRIELYLCIV